MNKLTAGFIALSIATRMASPQHWSPLMHCLRQPGIRGKGADDAQLKLYGQILPSGFLNYGYSDDPYISPERMCLADIEQAQTRYAERLVKHIADRNNCVLNSGCGMGGLTDLLLQNGFKPVALTPNRTQIKHIRATYPQTPLIEGKLEDIPLPKFHHAFGTVITSESFQYVNLDRGLAVMNKILCPGGRWILCDYFRTGESSRKSGHLWGDFCTALERNGWQVTFQEDITANVLPTIAYIHMWGRRFGLPVARFATDRLERKRPALHYILQEIIGRAHERIQQHLDIIDPAIFVREKKYLTLLIERRGSAV